MRKDRIIRVQDNTISVLEVNDSDYISLTDMVKNEEGNDMIRNWMRNRNTVEFLGVWEQLNNPNFKGVEFDTFRREAGLNSFNLTPKKWVNRTNAIGIISKPGRGGGTYAHKDLAFEFGAWISPTFKLYIIKEYERLKRKEQDKYNLAWNIRRVLTKVNYHFHIDAVQKHIIPKSALPEDKRNIEYAIEAEILNLALFGCTSKEWRKANPKHAKKGFNMRDFASMSQLIVMSNLESMNAEMVKLGSSKQSRYKVLRKTAKSQLEKLKNIDLVKAVRKQGETTYIEAQEKSGEELEKITSKSIVEKNRKVLSNLNKSLKKPLGSSPPKKDKNN